MGKVYYLWDYDELKFSDEEGNDCELSSENTHFGDEVDALLEKLVVNKINKLKQKYPDVEFIDMDEEE